MDISISGVDGMIAPIATAIVNIRLAIAVRRSDGSPPTYAFGTMSIASPNNETATEKGLPSGSATSSNSPIARNTPPAARSPTAFQREGSLRAVQFFIQPDIAGTAAFA